MRIGAAPPGAVALRGSLHSHLRVTVRRLALAFLSIARDCFSTMLDIFQKKDVWAGLMLIAIGAAAIFIARDYTFGTALRMGPGYFPKVLGAILILFGIFMLAIGLRGSDRLAGQWPLRALVIIPLSLVLFGVLIDPPGFLKGRIPGGFVPAMLVLIFGSATASTEFRFLETLIFSVFLTALAVAVFVYGLALPYPLFDF
jgi:Tripartite tricarboxylate transporter TctB family